MLTHTGTRTLLGGRAVLAILLMALLHAVSGDTAVLLYVIFGQGHFLLTYVEQYKKGQYSFGGFVRYMVFAAFAFGVALANQPAFIFFVSAFFLLHNFFDDMRLLATRDKRFAIWSTLPAMLFLLSLSYDYLYRTDYAIITTALAMLLTLVIAAICAQRRRLSDPYISYITTVTLFMYACHIALPDMGAEKLFGFIILSHYFNWYWHIYKKYQAIAPQRIRRYFAESLAVNGMLVMAFLAAVQVYGSVIDAMMQSPAFRLVFLPANFYAWTLMHLMVTLREQDYIPRANAAAA